MKPAYLCKEIRPVAKQAKRQGWRIQRTPGGHTVWISPKGRRIYTSATPSDSRAVKNLVAELKRAGYRE